MNNPSIATTALDGFISLARILFSRSLLSETKSLTGVCATPKSTTMRCQKRSRITFSIACRTPSIGFMKLSLCSCSRAMPLGPIQLRRIRLLKAQDWLQQTHQAWNSKVRNQVRLHQRPKVLLRAAVARLWEVGRNQRICWPGSWLSMMVKLSELYSAGTSAGTLLNSTRDEKVENKSDRGDSREQF